jgi:hypothetical protein
MNLRVVVVGVLTVIAVGVLYVFTFGPLGNRLAGRRANPASLKPSPVTQPPADTTSPFMNRYRNRDARENYYSVLLPADWSVTSGKNPGSYIIDFPQGRGWVELHDVPDNTTLELFILSQEEPKLRSSIAGYERREYRRDTIGGSPAYHLSYLSLAPLSDDTVQTERVYITGQDQAGLITFTTRKELFDSVKKRLALITNSFAWENP